MSEMDLRDHYWGSTQEELVEALVWCCENEVALMAHSNGDWVGSTDPENKKAVAYADSFLELVEMLKAQKK